MIKMMPLKPFLHFCPFQNYPAFESRLDAVGTFGFHIPSSDLQFQSLVYPPEKNIQY